MAVYGGPEVVTDGLVLSLDAGNPKSYSGSGTTWTDLSGRGNNGTLVNGVGYSADNRGCLVFDGTNDYVQFTTTSVQTICFWGRMDPSIVHLAGLVCTSVDGDGSLRAIRVGAVGTTVGTFRTSPDANDFHNGFVSSFMINGVSNLPSNFSTPLSGFVIPNDRTLQQDFYVGAIGNARNISTISHTFNSRLYRGRVYAVYLYDRQLTNAELLQNYAATRGRFGL